MPNPIADNDAVLLTTTVETQAQADALAMALVEAHLAACVQALPIRSTYRWEGRIQQSPEFLLLIKTRASRAPAAADFLQARHPYTLPEILVIPIQGGLPAYLQWIVQETTPPPPTTCACANAQNPVP